MAFQKEVMSLTGMNVQNAYIKIDEYACYGETVHVRLRAYVSKELADNGNAPIEGSEDIITLTVDYSDDATNTKKQIYEYAKTLDKYADAIDV